MYITVVHKSNCCFTATDIQALGSRAWGDTVDKGPKKFVHY